VADPSPTPVAPVPRGALHGIARPGRHGRPDGQPGVVAHLRDPMSLALVIPAPGRARACLERLASVGGPAVAALGARRAVQAEALELAWAGPDRYLAGVPADIDIEARLREACGDTAAIVDQSDGRFVLRLAGVRLRATLAKGVSIDLHPRVFVAGETALVQLAHLQVQLTRVDAESGFDLVAPRAAAGDVWAWLVASAAEFGLQMG
jgi:heterotetrameric sarcosine oxidase gamma subunit